MNTVNCEQQRTEEKFSCRLWQTTLKQLIYISNNRETVIMFFVRIAAVKELMNIYVQVKKNSTIVW